MFMNVYVHGYVYVYDSICWALKCPVHCAEQFLELKICISPQFRAIDPPNPAGGFIQQNENVRFATAACMQKYGNGRFATVACAKCMRYGGRGGGPYHGGGWQHGTRNHIYATQQFMVHLGWWGKWPWCWELPNAWFKSKTKMVNPLWLLQAVRQEPMNNQRMCWTWITRIPARMLLDLIKNIIPKTSRKGSREKEISF